MAGLAILGGKGYAALALRRTPNGEEFVFMHDGILESIGYAFSTPVRMRVAVAPDGECTFYMATPTGPFAALPQTFRAKEGGWIGAKAGLFSVASNDDAAAGYAEFDYFRFYPPG